MCSLSEFVTKKIGEIFQNEVAFKKRKNQRNIITKFYYLLFTTK